MWFAYNVCIVSLLLNLSNYLSSFRFVVRDFVWDDNAIQASKDAITKLAQDKKKQFVSLNFCYPLFFSVT